MQVFKIVFENLTTPRPSPHGGLQHFKGRFLSQATFVLLGSNDVGLVLGE